MNTVVEYSGKSKVIVSYNPVKAEYSVEVDGIVVLENGGPEQAKRAVGKSADWRVISGILYDCRDGV